MNFNPSRKEGFLGHTEGDNGYMVYIPNIRKVVAFPNGEVIRRQSRNSVDGIFFLLNTNLKLRDPAHESFCFLFFSLMILVQWLLLATLAVTGLPCVLCIFESANFCDIRQAHRISYLPHFWTTAGFSLQLPTKKI